MSKKEFICITLGAFCGWLTSVSGGSAGLSVLVGFISTIIFLEVLS